MNVAFRRTISGLKNQHLFHQVDFVVFVEGGKTQFNKDEVYSGNYNNETEDIIFWTKIFNTFVNGKKLKFKSVGSKSTIKKIAVDIMEGEINTILVAMDNEFDEILKKRIAHPNVYYTFGYSWENDVWSPVVVKKVIEELTAINIEHTDIENNFKNLIKALKLAVYADGYLFKNHQSFFPRKSSRLFCVECNPADLPFIKRDEINKRLVDNNIKKTNLYSFGSRHKIRTQKLCYGHLLSDYCTQLIMNYLKNRHSLKNIPKNIVCRIGINKFFKENFSKGDIFKYYEEQFNKNVA